MLNVIDEPKLVQDYNTEYYKLINFFSNTKRQSSFVKYYNLAGENSPKNELTKEVYDFYSKSKSFWNIYDLTPTQIISAIQNTPDNVGDLKGQMIVSATTILVYTIDMPRVGDLVTFYKPAESEEVLRVMNVRLQLNSNISTEPLKWYELDLETAPVRYDQLDNLQKKDHFVYDLTIEKNVEYIFYKKYVDAMNKLSDLLLFFNKYYISETDVYTVDNKIIQELNELLFFIKKIFDKKYNRLFEKIKSPFGYWDRIQQFKYSGIEEMNFNKSKEFTAIDYSCKFFENINLSSFNYSEEVEEVLIQTINLLDYINIIGEYLEHNRS